ncbi:hypothetical protein LGT39_06325 [Demequina sp. TTPB684]|uniref:hypothetical protein n=1 Tax=unclassified Demequina TaxID=2620311 RepID=UPI001CF4343B|nr:MULTISPECIES: hypothetical protein [unclassified Demequina]MCB2412465.1 hypothetical protein [Demequina sp. TTPB684]UPU87701.1 hypothetical protein LGT36_010620 [Demequina sp. TMPB413]
MVNITKAGAIALAVLALAACGESKGVPWDNYDASVKERIDSFEASADCDGLQAEFDTADANNAQQRERTGTGNAELMEYLDDIMRDVGCYS